MAGLADHKGLASPPRHEAHPGRGVRQPHWVELGELADVVDLDVLGPFAELTPAGQEPINEFLAADGWGCRTIGGDRGGLPSERDGTEPYGQVVPAAAAGE